MPVRVVPVPALEDNYMYVVIDEETKQCGVVDPVDAAAIQTAAEREGATAAGGGREAVVMVVQWR